MVGMEDGGWRVGGGGWRVRGGGWGWRVEDGGWRVGGGDGGWRVGWKLLGVFLSSSSYCVRMLLRSDR